MMAKSSVPDRFKDKYYLNWIKLGQALVCVAEGLTTYCINVVDKVHGSLKEKIGQETCTAGCTVEKITKQGPGEGKPNAKNTPSDDTPKTHGTGENKSWSIDCSCNICNRWLDGIIAEMGEKRCSWKHTDVNKWPTQSWQLAKICMGPGKPPSNHAPAKTDVVGLLQLIINCKAFDDPSLKQQASTVKNIRNELFHSNTFKVNDKNMKTMITQMIDLLEHGILADDITAQNAVEDIKEIQRFVWGNGKSDVVNIEHKLWSEIIYNGEGNKEAILAFLTANEDLKERLGPKVEELRKDVDELKGQVSLNTTNIERLWVKWKYFEQVKLPATRSIKSAPDNWNTDTLQGQESDDEAWTRTSPSEGTTKFCVGEQVRVVSDEWEAVRLQEEHGGWNDEMRKYIGQIGTIKGTQEDLIEVQFSDGETWHLNKALLQPFTEQTDQAGEDSRPFERYDIVSLEKDKKTVMQLQKGHGGWKPSMTWVLGLNGVVSKVKENGDVFVEYSNDNTYWFNPKLLEVADTSHMQIDVGDFVLVIDSARKVEALQDEDHGGWSGKMRKTLGSTGTVVGTLSNGRARVFISGDRWIYNVNALRHIARSGRPASNTAPSDDSPSSDSHAETDVLFYDRTDPPLASQTATGSRVRTQIDLGRIFCEGEKVRVDSDESVAIQLQEELVGWNDEMKQYLSKTGVVKCEQGNIVEVVFPDCQTWFINKALLQICNDDSDEEEEEDQNRPFNKYDIVSIERDKETAKARQEDHGGYADRMALVLGSRGYVLKVDDDGDVHVKCINQSKWCFNPKLLEVVDTSKMAIEIGDFVFVINSYAKVKALQDEDPGGWQEEMRENLGVIGTVVDILPNRLVNVVISGKSWIYNMKAIRHIARSDIDPISNATTSGDKSSSDPDSDSGMGSLHRLKRLTELLDRLRSSTERRTGDSDDDDDDDDEKFGRGCQVRLDAKESRVIHQQKGHGGWHKEKKKYLGQVGVVKGKRSGDIVVQFPDGVAFLCNKALLKLCDKEEKAGRGLPFKRYDIVVIEKNKDRVKELQEGHGGWKESLVSVLGKNAIVNRIDGNGDVFVELPRNTNQWFNPKLLTVVDTTNVKIRVGDLVVVIDSYKKVKALQDKAHGGWTSEMRKFLGSASIVVAVLSRGRVKVFLDKPRVFNVKAVRFISRRDGTGSVEQRAPAEERTRADESALPEERAPAAGNWMENTKASIRKILPSLEPDVPQAIMDHFVSIGVESESDLKLLKESDLEQFLKPIQRRKLVLSWEAKRIDPISDSTTSDDTSSSGSDSESDSDSDSGIPSLHRLTELKELLKGLRSSMTGSLIDSDDDDDDDDDDEEFVRGSRVRVDADVLRSSRLQEGHGGWNKDMKKYLGKVGVVKRKLSGKILVQFPDGRALLYNKALLTLCDEEDTEEEDRRSHPFRRYDIVVIEKNKDRVMALQGNHGGWKTSLISVLGKNAIVNRIDEDGDVFVELPDDTNQFFNPKLLTVIDTTNVKIAVGDLVVVIDCYKTFRTLQEEAHVVWTSGMLKLLGSAGKIVAELSNGRVQVFMASRSWMINVKAVTFISRADGTGAVEQRVPA